MTPAARAVTMSVLACSVGATAGAQNARGTMPQERTGVSRPASPSTLGLQGYSVVLVVGDMQGSAGGETVPPAARKALTDMQAFLPYKRYQLLDAAWMLCCGAFRTPIAGRMRGPEDREYAYSIETTGGEDGKLTLHFSMREVDAQAIVSSSSNVAAGGRGSASTSVSTSGQHGLTATTAAAATPVARGTLLDSTFSIAVGETVVIGTSRLKGDQALIALLTAAAKPGAAR